MRKRLRQIINEEVKKQKAIRGIRKMVRQVVREEKNKKMKKVYNTKIENPKTGKEIKLKTALSYGSGHPAFKKAKKIEKKAKEKFGGGGDDSSGETEKKTKDIGKELEDLGVADKDLSGNTAEDFRKAFDDYETDELEDVADDLEGLQGRLEDGEIGEDEIKDKLGADAEPGKIAKNIRNFIDVER
jgi:hypothetical protein